MIEMKHNLLNGKCLKYYLKWYKDVYSKEQNIHEDGTSVNYMPFNMAYGVFIDFFNSVGIDINIFQTPINCFRLYIKVNGKVEYNPMREQNEEKTLKTRTEARQKAIEKANELFNTKEI